MCRRRAGRKHPHQEFTPVDTTNILFICGGAFVGLEKVIARRTGKKSMGFLQEEDKDREGCGHQRTARYRPAIAGAAGRPDQVRFHPGIHRPAAGERGSRRLGPLGADPDPDRPKNAIIKQYQKLFEFENVRLKFSDDSLEAIADLAMERGLARAACA
jgi:ATP-dependent Clp protease ATP-binding subunit ClpX